ncbi:PhzF family phenazine biosynthesis protein [Aquabacter sediminis]|uniref:PhzF family phenazine biosynthesis protein n=1 Tax=Aquabacter sediminis TaxID=3029197 RepID=UPI00237E0B74|nr:PhzF family phenazine biosynthesis protein [Aquabacter sp. P-9]MDE1568191.1 PhzF family phenazine biosynthesis protein [Aquabacter sp. P-9]
MSAVVAFDGPAPTAALDIVDVFSDLPGRGNPVAVAYGCDGASKGWKQDFARWIGLPETVFVTPAPQAGGPHHIEIFAPACELPFAGHPAIGAVRSLLDRALAAPAVGEITLRCAAGLVSMRIDEGGETISFRTPGAAQVSPLPASTVREVAECLNGPAALREVVIADTGARWIIAALDAVEDLYRLAPDMARIARLSLAERVNGISVVAEVQAPAGARMPELRSFAPAIGVPEDAVCGGGNACVAAALSAWQGFAPSSADYVARQGRALGRDGRVEVRGPDEDLRFRIGGRAHRMVCGDLRVPA